MADSRMGRKSTGGARRHGARLRQPEGPSHQTEAGQGGGGQRSGRLRGQRHRMDVPPAALALLAEEEGAVPAIVVRGHEV